MHAVSLWLVVACAAWTARCAVCEAHRETVSVTAAGAVADVVEDGRGVPVRESVGGDTGTAAPVDVMCFVRHGEARHNALKAQVRCCSPPPRRFHGATMLAGYGVSSAVFPLCLSAAGSLP